MKLLEVARILSLLGESIDIHGLARLHKGNPGFEQAVKDYRATLQGRKKTLLKPFGLDDLDKFKENPEDFVKMVGYAVDSFKEKKEEKALYKKIYEDSRCIIIMPKGPKGAAAAGSLCKVNGEVRCPWCVCIKYPENEKWWTQYGAAALVFIYAKEEGGVATDACCMLLTASDSLSILKDGTLAYSQLEGIENKGLDGKPKKQRKVLERLYGKTGLADERLVGILRPVLKSMEEELNVFVVTRDLVAAVEEGDAARVRECLDAGADVNRRERREKTPLHLAAERGNLEVCKLLIDAGAEVDARDKYGWTPLVQESGSGNLEVCKLLIDAGADVDARDKSGCTPLLHATIGGYLEVCKLLIEAGADVNIPTSGGWSPLLWASAKGDLEICKLFLDTGAIVNARNRYGGTPLSNARTNGHTEVVDLLLQAGAEE